MRARNVRKEVLIDGVDFYITGIDVRNKWRYWSEIIESKQVIQNGVLYVGGLCTSVAMLYQAFAYLPVSVAYAVWVGIGTAGAVLVNMLFSGNREACPEL